MKNVFFSFIIIFWVALFALLPGSICVAVPVCLILYAFGLGRRSAVADDDSPLPWYLLVHGAGMMAGALINLAYWILIAGRGL